MIAKAVRAFFERVATDRDAMRLAYYDERVIEKMAAVSGLIGAMIAADVGTGTGFVAAGLAPWAGTVVGGDNSPAMPAASRNLDPLGVRNVELVEGDAAALPPESGSVDAAFDNMVLHDAEDPGAMLEEMARVVRPGGTVAITDEVEHPYRWMREEHADARLGFSEGQFGGFFRGRARPASGTSPWGCGDASAPRPRGRSPTSGPLPSGGRSPRLPTSRSRSAALPSPFLSAKLALSC